jgi:hypothetical protein
MELVGLSYSSWFVYRYLLFKARAPRERPTANHAAGHCICLPCPAAGARRGARPAGLVATTCTVALPPQTALSAASASAGACFWQATRNGGDLSLVAAL